MKKAVVLVLLIFAISGSYLLYLQLNSKTQDEEKPLTASDLPAESYDVVEESEEALVDQFPDLPEYPNATLTHSARYNEEGGEGFSSEYSTRDSVADVVEWYRNNMPDDWTLVYESETTADPDFYLLEYKKPDIQLDIHSVELDDGSVKITTTHHLHMGEYGPKIKYE